MQVSRIGLDIAKNVFPVPGVDAQGKVVVRKQLSRSKGLPFFAQLPGCRIGMEACGSAHDWGRELQKVGHEVRLMAGQLIKPYRPKQQNDRNDAEAIGEAVSRPQRRFVPIKTGEQQAVLTVQRAGELWVTERTAVAKQLRGLFLPSNVHIVPDVGSRGVGHALLAQVFTGSAVSAPVEAQSTFGGSRPRKGRVATNKMRQASSVRRQTPSFRTTRAAGCPCGAVTLAAGPKFYSGQYWAGPPVTHSLTITDFDPQNSSASRDSRTLRLSLYFSCELFSENGASLLWRTVPCF